MRISAHKLASRLIGVREIKGAVDNPHVMAMLRLDASWPQNDEVPWCSAFVNYVCFLLGLPRTKSLMARSWLKAGEAIDLSSARPENDIVILWRGAPDGPSGHVGFFDGLAGRGGISILGGNQSDSVSVSTYPESMLLGIRRLAPPQ